MIINKFGQFAALCWKVQKFKNTFEYQDRQFIDSIYVFYTQNLLFDSFFDCLRAHELKDA